MRVLASKRTPAQIRRDVAREYNVPPGDVHGVIYERKSTYMAARAYVRALRAEYPEGSERWLARTARRQVLTVRKLLSDDTADYPGDRRKKSAWGDRDSGRLVELVNKGLSGPELCREFEIQYPEGRNTLYCEISRLIDAHKLRRGRLGFPRKPAE